ncbi:MAG: anion permease, partial [Sulfurimonas sp.]|nr:anion permease [Sulfurimonas sp.]
YALAIQTNMDAKLFMMVATVCASYAFMLPIATPPNAIAMSSGALNVKDMLRYGFLLNLIGIFFVVIIAEFFWR